jgi:hypothetical protein
LFLKGVGYVNSVITEEILGIIWIVREKVVNLWKNRRKMVWKIKRKTA